jgi:hypothetical protein
MQLHGRERERDEKYIYVLFRNPEDKGKVALVPN